MAGSVWMVSGSKGGVGKSTVSMALVHYMQTRGSGLLFVEADTANPDVGKVYGKTIETLYLDLDEKEGWMDLVNRLGDHPEQEVVINTPARSGEGVKLYGALLAEALEELKRRLITLWVINSQRDSLQLLREFLEVMQSGETHVLRNLYHGPERKFELYNGSKLREAIEAKGKTLNFPDVADRISDQLHSDRLTIEEIIAKAPLGNRVEVNRWVRECALLFQEVMP